MRRNRTRRRGRPKARSPLLRGGARNRRRNAQLPAEAQGAGRQPGTFSRRLSKNPGDFERAAALSSFNRIRRRVRRIRGNFFGGELVPPEKKLLPCSFRARKCEAFQRKLVGVAVAGELAPPPHILTASKRPARPGTRSHWDGTAVWRPAARALPGRRPSCARFRPCRRRLRP